MDLRVKFDGFGDALSLLAEVVNVCYYAYFTNVCERLGILSIHVCLVEELLGDGWEWRSGELWTEVLCHEVAVLWVEGASVRVMLGRRWRLHGSEHASKRGSSAARV